MPVDEFLKKTALDLRKKGKSHSEILDLISQSENYSDVGGIISDLRNDNMRDSEIWRNLVTANKSTPQGVMKEDIEKSPPSRFGAFGVGVGQGAYELGKGIQQKAAMLGESLGLSSPETTKRITAEGQQQRELFQPLSDVSTSANVGKFVGETAPMMAIPGGVAGGLGRRALTGALSGGLTGGMRFTGEDESTIGNAALGAGFGAASPYAFAVPGKVINAIKGRLNKPINVGSKFGIPTTLGEDIGNPHLERVETFMERIPIIGTMAFRKRQHLAAEASAKDYVAKSFMPDNANQVRGMLEHNKNYVSRLYENFKQELSGYKELPLYAKETNKAASELLDENKAFFKKFGNEKLENLIQSIKDDVSYAPMGTAPAAQAGAKKIQGQTLADIQNKIKNQLNSRTIDEKLEDSILSSVNAWKKTKVPSVADVIPNPKTQLTFDDMWKLRKGLGDMLGQAKRKIVSGDINETEYRRLSKLYSAVTEDMDNFTESVGNKKLAEGFKTANDAYKQFVIKYNVIDRAMDKSMGQEIIDQATGKVINAGKDFSPQRFSSNLDKILKDEKYTNLFTPEEKTQMAGLANIMGVIKRAGQYKENPPTGNRAIDVAVGGGALGSFFNAAAAKVMATTAGFTGTLRFLTTTQSGKKLVMAASKYEPDSPQMRKIVDTIYRTMPRAATNVTVDSQSQ